MGRIITPRAIEPGASSSSARNPTSHRMNSMQRGSLLVVDQATRTLMSRSDPNGPVGRISLNPNEGVIVDDPEDLASSARTQTARITGAATTLRPATVSDWTELFRSDSTSSSSSMGNSGTGPTVPEDNRPIRSGAAARTTGSDRTNSSRPPTTAAAALESYSTSEARDRQRERERENAEMRERYTIAVRRTRAETNARLVVGQSGIPSETETSLEPPLARVPSDHEEEQDRSQEVDSIGDMPRPTISATTTAEARNTTPTPQSSSRERDRSRTRDRFGDARPSAATAARIASRNMPGPSSMPGEETVPSRDPNESSAPRGLQREGNPYRNVATEDFELVRRGTVVREEAGAQLEGRGAEHFSQVEGEGVIRAGLPHVIYLGPVPADLNAAEALIRPAGSNGPPPPAEPANLLGSSSDSNHVDVGSPAVTPGRTADRSRTESEQVIDQAIEEEAEARFEARRQGRNEQARLLRQARARSRAMTQSRAQREERDAEIDDASTRVIAHEDASNRRAVYELFEPDSDGDEAYLNLAVSGGTARGTLERDLNMLERVMEAEEPEDIDMDSPSTGDTASRRSRFHSPPRDPQHDSRRLRRRTERMLETERQLDAMLDADRAFEDMFPGSDSHGPTSQIATGNSLNQITEYSSLSGSAPAPGETNGPVVAGIGRTTPPGSWAPANPDRTSLLAFGSTRRYFSEPESMAPDYPYIAPELLRSAVAAGSVNVPTTSSNVTTSPLSLARRSAVRRRRPLDPAAAPFVPYGAYGAPTATTASARLRHREMVGQKELTDKFLTRREWASWLAARPRSQSAIAYRDGVLVEGAPAGAPRVRLNLKYAEPTAAAAYARSTLAPRPTNATSSMTRSEELLALFGVRSPPPELNFFAATAEDGEDSAGLDSRARLESLMSRIRASRNLSRSQNPGVPNPNRVGEEEDDEEDEDGASADIDFTGGFPGITSSSVAPNDWSSVPPTREYAGLRQTFGDVTITTVRPPDPSRVRPFAASGSASMTYEDIVDELRRAEGEPDELEELEFDTII